MGSSFRKQYPERKQTDEDGMHHYFENPKKFKEDDGVAVDQRVENMANKLHESKLENTGFVVYAIVMIVLSLIFLGTKSYFSGVGSVLMTVVSSVLFRKNPILLYGKDENFYFANVTITLKAIFKHFSITAKLMDYAHTILVLSILILGMDQLVFRFVLFSFASDAIAILSMWGFWIGVIFSFSKREMKQTYLALICYYFFSLIFLIVDGLFFGKLSAGTAITALLVWIFAGWVRQISIKDVSNQIKTNE